MIDKIETLNPNKGIYKAPCGFKWQMGIGPPNIAQLGTNYLISSNGLQLID